MEGASLTRMPGFVRGYVEGGIGPEDGLARNISELRAVRLKPRCFGGGRCRRHKRCRRRSSLAAPIGVAPMGLGGLIWPGCETVIAKAAAAAGIGHVLSTYANSGVEKIAPLAGPGGWFQVYPP